MRPIASQYPVPMGLLAILAMFGLLVVVICETENVAKSVEDSVQNWGWQHANWTMDDDQLGADDELREFESSKRWDWRVYERSWEVESRRGGGRSRNGRRSEEEWRRRGRRCEEDDDDEEDEEEEEEDDRRKIRSAESDRRKIRSATQAGDDDGGVKQNVDENGGKKEEEEGGEGIETRQKPAAADGAILLNSKEKRRLRSRSSEEEGEGRCRRRGRWSEWRWVGECSDECGGFGRRTRRRRCLSERCPCRGRACERKRCNRTPCVFPRLSCAPGLRVTTERRRRHGEQRLVCRKEEFAGDTKKQTEGGG